ncbi:hypothetical protein HZF24_08985 [Sedimentibacter hydroxybenzoicus DSM 7310]|uniref:Uncharacterized protein n=1 Tax=Sedimentibacter hydroxybenzoicus DSM 7310 TaxID=1123245 RepID=A0A974BJM5_SEDHY|nr:hypothetical protein [Sedimentibacter hydroxybenzoicus]NYB74278.1 hypothetical protein [Sedimentibacter hydroxybenzoicus DSM 7310]
MSKRIKSKLIRKKLIFISLIISLSIMGIGYAAWNDGTKINVSMKTGFIKSVFLLDNTKDKFKDGELFYSLSQGGRVLDITGEVYPSFNKDITIKIIDEGTIPSGYSGLEEDAENEISELNEYSGKQRKNLNIHENYIEHFELKINPDSNYEEARQFNEAFSNISGEISNLEQAINELEAKIRLYDNKRNYRFEYVLNFEQEL